MKLIQLCLIVTSIVIVLTFSILAIYSGKNFFYVVIIVGGGLFPFLFIMLYIFNIIINRLFLFHKSLINQLLLGIGLSFITLILFLIFDDVELSNQFDISILIDKIRKLYIVYTIFPVFTVLVNFLFRRQLGVAR